MKADPEHEEVGQRLKLLRERLALMNARQFADELGVKAPTYYAVEGGHRPLSLNIATAICDRYFVTLDYLFRGDLRTLPFETSRLLGYEDDPLAEHGRLVLQDDLRLRIINAAVGNHRSASAEALAALEEKYPELADEQLERGIELLLSAMETAARSARGNAQMSEGIKLVIASIEGLRDRARVATTNDEKFRIALQLRAMISDLEELDQLGQGPSN